MLYTVYSVHCTEFQNTVYVHELFHAIVLKRKEQKNTETKDEAVDIIMHNNIVLTIIHGIFKCYALH